MSLNGKDSMRNYSVQAKSIETGIGTASKSVMGLEAFGTSGRNLVTLTK